MANTFTVNCYPKGTGTESGWVNGVRATWDGVTGSANYTRTAYASNGNGFLTLNENGGPATQCEISIIKLVLDTSNIPAGATITSATLHLYKNSDAGNVGTVYGDWSSGTSALATSDWTEHWALPVNGAGDLTSTAFSSVLHTALPSNGQYYTFSLTSTGNINIGPGALTVIKIGCGSNGPGSTTYPAATNNSISFISGDSTGGAQAPYVSVTFTTDGGSDFFNFF